MKALNPKLASLWKATFPCLEKASVKKTLHFKETCEELGLVYQHAPKYLEVRFRWPFSSRRMTGGCTATSRRLLTGQANFSVKSF